MKCFFYVLLYFNYNYLSQRTLSLRLLGNTDNGAMNFETPETLYPTIQQSKDHCCEELKSHTLRRSYLILTVRLLD